MPLTSTELFTGTQQPTARSPSFSRNSRKIVNKDGRLRMPSGSLPLSPPPFRRGRVFPVCLFCILEVDLENAVFFKHVFCFLCSPLSSELAAHGAPPAPQTREWRNHLHRPEGRVVRGPGLSTWPSPASATAPFPTSRECIGQPAFFVFFLVIGSLAMFCVQISAAGGPLYCLKARIYRRHDPLNAPRHVQPRKQPLKRSG